MGPDNTPAGKLPPFEVAKVMAFEHVFDAMEKHMGKTTWQILGMRRKDFAAKHVKASGGPGKKPRPVTGRAVQKHWTKAKQDGNWYPGKRQGNPGGRPPVITEAQMTAIASKAMELKEDLILPTPEKIRVCLPRLTINRSTQEPISDWKIREVFKTMCYDENEDDPWQFLPSLQQDCLTDEEKPRRAKTANHVLEHVSESAAFNFVAIDPCFSMLPKKQSKAQLLKIAAMGIKKWMSEGSRRKGANLRAPATAKTQKEGCDIVSWTPVFARGRLRLVVFTNEKNMVLNKSYEAANFVRDILPEVLTSMKDEWGWPNVPKVVLHDKASYFVDSTKNQLNTAFAAGLKAGKFTSWVDVAGDNTKWLAAKLGDFYPHETVISHVRRLLVTKFAKNSLNESPGQFAARMKKVEEYLNYEMGGGDALVRLGKEFHTRARKLKDLKGERIPK